MICECWVWMLGSGGLFVLKVVIVVFLRSLCLVWYSLVSLVWLVIILLIFGIMVGWVRWFMFLCSLIMLFGKWFWGGYCCWVFLGKICCFLILNWFCCGLGKCCVWEILNWKLLCCVFFVWCWWCGWVIWILFISFVRWSVLVFIVGCCVEVGWKLGRMWNLVLSCLSMCWLFLSSLWWCLGVVDGKFVVVVCGWLLVWFLVGFWCFVGVWVLGWMIFFGVGFFVFFGYVIVICVVVVCVGVVVW